MKNVATNITAEWTGSYPCLCHGEWIIHVDGIKLTGIQNDSFNTLGNYDEWYFGDNWSEEWDSYRDGVCFEEWVADVPNGLRESLVRHCIEPTSELLHALYVAISDVDWRSGSCGGCI